MTRSKSRFKPAIQAVSRANDSLLPKRDLLPEEIPEREVKLPSTIRRMALQPKPIEHVLALRDAPPPPPGYRYTLDGRLVPLEEIQQRIDDPEAQAMFCEIIEITGSLRAACDALGITSMSRVKAYMTRDIDFCEAVEAAADRHRQNLYAHAVQRATVGIQEPIFGGKDKDVIVGYKTVRSDALLIKLLQRHFPEFRGDHASNAPPPVDANEKLPDFNKMTREERDAYLLLVKKTPDVIDAEGIEKEDDPNPEQN